MMTNANNWPPRPTTWPDVMSEVEVCQYLRLDDCRTVDGARRSLRHIRRTQGLRAAGRIGGRVVFRKATVDAWLAGREAGEGPLSEGAITGPTSDPAQVPNQSGVVK